MVKKVDKRELELLAQVRCTQAEICAVLDIGRSTLQSRVREMYDLTVDEFLDHHGAKFDATLRRRIMATAFKGNPALLKWLGEYFLDINPKQKLEHDGKVGVEPTGNAMAEIASIVLEAIGDRAAKPSAAPAVDTAEREE